MTIADTSGGTSPLRSSHQAPPERTLIDIVDEVAAAHPQAPAIDDGQHVLTYEALRLRMQTDAALLHDAGVRRGDRVGVRMTSGTVDLYATILGIMQAGACYVPVDADDPQERADLVFGEAKVAAIVTDGGIQPGDMGRSEPAATSDAPEGAGETLAGASADTAASPDTAPLATPADDQRPGLDDDAWVIFTSGSTGVPKGVAIRHRNAAAFVDAERRVFLQDAPLGPGDRVLAGLSVAFDASCEEMWLAWGNGACLVPAPRSLVRSGGDLGPWLSTRRITVVSTVPTLAAMWPAEALDNVRLLIFGGEACPAELAERLCSDDREVWNTYGPTEATVVACAAQMGGPGPVRIGLPLPGWDLAVVGEDGYEVPHGEVGELVIGGVGLGRYLDPAKDAEKYAPSPQLGWDRAYRSGDLVVHDEEGLLFRGRADDQVKLGGRRIELGEVDAALSALPEVSGGAAAVQSTEAGNQVLVGYVVGHQPGLDLSSLTEQLRAELPAALVPRLAEVDHLPTRTSGKVDRNALPWPLDSLGQDSTDDLPAEVRELAGHWQAILGASPSSEDDDFFSLGGGSLPAAQLVARLRETYPTVTVADLYAHPTLRAQASMLADMAPSSGPAEAARRQVSPVRKRARVGQLVAGLALAIVPGLQWTTVALTLSTLLAWADVPWASSTPWPWLVAGWVLLLSPLGRLALTALVCRVLLIGIQPGSYLRGGSVHLRLWFCERFADTAGAHGLAGAPWIRLYARALGAKVGKGVDLHSLPPVTGLLALGDQCSVEPEVDLSGMWIDGDVVRVGRVKVGARAVIGTRSTLLPGARVGKDAIITPGSSVGGRVPARAAWGGSPAVPVGKPKGSWPDTKPPRGRVWVAVYAISAAFVGGLPFLAGLAGVATAWPALAGTDTFTDAAVTLLAWSPVITLVTLLMLALLTIIVVRLCSIGLRAGTHPVRSRIGWQIWLTERVLDQARTWLFPLYASTITPTWLRLLGAKVGKDVEASTVLLVPSMTTIGDQAFLADDTLVASYELHRGWMRVGPVKVGRRAFLGNSGMLAPGRRVRADGLVAVLSAAPRKSKKGTSWLGSPPVKLPRESGGGDEGRTYDPPTRLKALRAAVEVARLIPVMVSVALAVGVLLVLEAVNQAQGAFVAVLVSPLVLVGTGILAAAITVVAKWLVVGRTRVRETPLWSSFVWRNEVVDVFTEMVAAPWFAWPATGSPALNVFLRGMGAHIGRGVWCESYWLPEGDLVTLGDGSTVNRGCVVQTHLFHDRVMSMDTVILGEGATLGPHSVVLPQAEVGDHATVGPASLVLRGEPVPAATRWQGNPIAPVQEDSA